MYAKVFRSLWDGTLADSLPGWATFVFLLAHADADGVVEMTPKAIAKRSSIPLEDVIEAITILTSPDPDSRSQEEGGRRMILLPERTWGWQIVNYERYRSIRDAEERRGQVREAVRRHRARNQDVINVSHGKPPSSTVSHGKPRKAQEEVEVEGIDSKHMATADAAASCVIVDNDKSLTNGGPPDADEDWRSGFSEFYDGYPRKVKRPAAERAWMAIRPQGADQGGRNRAFGAVLTGLEAWCAHWRSEQTPKDKIPYPATFLNGRQFEDQPT